MNEQPATSATVTPGFDDSRGPVDGRSALSSPPVTPNDALVTLAVIDALGFWLDA